MGRPLSRRCIPRALRHVARRGHAPTSRHVARSAHPNMASRRVVAGGRRAGWTNAMCRVARSIVWAEHRGHYNKGTAALPTASPTAWASRAAHSRLAASPAAGKCHVTHERHGGRGATGWENHRTACVRGVGECLCLVAVECACVCWHVCARADASATRAVLWWLLLFGAACSATARPTHGGRLSQVRQVRLVGRCEHAVPHITSALLSIGRRSLRVGKVG